MVSLDSLKIRIFADGADLNGIRELAARPYIQGITTNPTLMRKAGVRDYEAFARDVLQIVTGKPVSFEVLADEFSEMRRQALKIGGWGANVYVKIPITNSRGESSVPLIADLVRERVKVNVTAMLAPEQVRGVAEVLDPDVPAIASVFAGRIADTGRDPVPVMRECRAILRDRPHTDLLWASVREVLNIVQADQAGCTIVTVTHDILAKAVKLLGLELSAMSLDTVRMFARDAQAAGYRL